MPGMMRAHCVGRFAEYGLTVEEAASQIVSSKTRFGAGLCHTLPSLRSYCRYIGSECVPMQEACVARYLRDARAEVSRQSPAERAAGLRACEDAAKAADAAAVQQRRVFEGMLRDAHGSFRIAFERLREEQTGPLAKGVPMA